MKRIILLLTLLLPWPALANDAAQDVLNCMRANVPPSVRMESVSLTTTDRSGKSSTLEGTVYAQRVKQDGGHARLQAMLRLDAPKDLAGAAYLMRETDDYLRDGMYVYLPSVKRVRRVTGSFADGGLLGTDFSYFDFKQMKSAFGDMKAKLEAPDSYNGRGAWVLLFKPLEGVETEYTGVRVWVDQKACVAVKADFLQGNKTIKQLSTPKGAIRQAGSYWYLTTLEMRVPGKDSRTVLKVGKVVNNAKLSPRYFDPRLFYLGR